MIDLLNTKWNKIKDHIEELKPYAENDLNVVKEIRRLKNEAHVLYFAMENMRLYNMSSEDVLKQMREDRELYNRLQGG